MQKLFWVLLIGLVGCQSAESDLAEPELLYRTWTRTIDGVPAQYPLVVQFTPDGNLFYGANKQPGGCCQPSTFLANQSQVVFSFKIGPECATVLCAVPELQSGVNWKIEKLNASDLVLSSNGTTLTFKAL